VCIFIGNAVVIVDGAQSVPHMPVSVKELDCDFLVFSAHKMCGPTGIGVLYGKKELLENMQPFLYGGDMIRTVSYENATWNDLPWKFEAGTPNIADGIAFGTAIDFLTQEGMGKIQKHEKELTNYAIKKLSKIKNISVYGPKIRAGVIAFNLKGIHAHDVSALLDTEGIAVRGGHHCAMPLTKKLGMDASVRASFYLYNTKKDVDALIKGLKKVEEVFA